MIDWTQFIESNPDILFGKPVIANTRIPVDLILEKLASGDTNEDLLEAYPAITKDHIASCLLFAADSIKHETFISLIKKKPFNYAHWQDALWGDETVELISEKAMEYRAKKQGKEPDMKPFKSKTMHLEARKITFVREFLRLQNEEIVSQLEKLLRKTKSDIFEKELSPMSLEQFNSEIDKSMADSETGKIIPARELKKKVNKWG